LPVPSTSDVVVSPQSVVLCWLHSKYVMGATDATVVAQPLAPSDVDLPKATQEILEKGKRSWLKNTEVCDMLLNYTACNLRVAKEPPCKPPGKVLS